MCKIRQTLPKKVMYFFTIGRKARGCAGSFNVPIERRIRKLNNQVKMLDESGMVWNMEKPMVSASNQAALTGVRG